MPSQSAILSLLWHNPQVLPFPNNSVAVSPHIRESSVSRRINTSFRPYKGTRALWYNLVIDAANKLEGGRNEVP
jgi:hypothetical protein